MSKKNMFVRVGVLAVGVLLGMIATAGSSFADTQIWRTQDTVAVTVSTH